MLVDEDRGIMYPLLRFFRRSCIPQKLSNSRPGDRFNKSVSVSGEGSRQMNIRKC